MLTAKRCGADCVKFQKSSLKDKFTARYKLESREPFLKEKKAQYS
jgi:hypothetical protein